MARPKKNANTAPAPTDNQAHQKNLDRLETTTNDICDRIADSGRSYTVRAVKARNVDPKVVEAGFRKIEDSIKRGREAYAEAQRDDDVATVARVDLRNL
jgi:hypothetical protein